MNDEKDILPVDGAPVGDAVTRPANPFEQTEQVEPEADHVEQVEQAEQTEQVEQVSDALDEYGNPISDEKDILPEHVPTVEPARGVIARDVEPSGPFGHMDAHVGAGGSYAAVDASVTAAPGGSEAAAAALASGSAVDADEQQHDADAHDEPVVE